MKKRIFAWLVSAVLCLTAAAPALAANIFMFTEKSITLNEGETYQTALKREGNLAGDGEIVYASGKQNVATVSQDGVITAVGKGRTEVTAALNRNGKRVGRAVIVVNVVRTVTGVSLNTARMSVYDAADPAVAGMLLEETANRVIVIPAGTSLTLSAALTPADAANKKVTYSTTDPGIAKVTGTALKAVQRGECDLVVASAQNPQVTETYRLMVIQPVKTIRINAGAKKVTAGATLQLTAECLPENASMPKVTWSSRNPSIATVDGNGLVTGLQRGSAVITATAADGSRVTASVTISVAQPAGSITFKNPEITVNVGKSTAAKVTVLPANTSDKSLTWSTSDPSVATVNAHGQVTGRKAGTCTLTCTSNSNPDVSASATVTVAQLVTRIECATPQENLNMLAGGTMQLDWIVAPEDATNKGLNFKSLHPKVVRVDADGLVTAVGRGTGTVVATAKDGSGRKATAKISVIQPVTGVSMQQEMYYVQRGWNTQVRALIQPRNANNQKVTWTCADERIATVRSSGTSTGSVYGMNDGYSTVTAYTEDGGFTASATIRVGNFNHVVMTEDLFVDANNNIRITMLNMSRDITLGSIHFVIECFDTDGNPMVCNTDGVSTSFEGDYPFLLGPYDRTVHGSFRFRNYVIDQTLGAVTLTVVSWTDADGYTWKIPEMDWFRTTWNRDSDNPGQNQEQGVG